MQYLYTLTSTPGDNYYEQFLLSAASLKLKMPSTQIVLLCDSKTKETLTGKRSEYEKLTAKVITKDAPSSFSQVDVSRWIKTSMRRFVQGDFLFIDCDTIITDDLSYIEKLNVKFGACLDKHSLVDSHNNKNLIVNNDKQLGFSSYTGNRHFNSGVIYCADSPEIHKVFDRWHELWLIGKNKNISRDQPAFNQA
ncbi:MAG: hypothetical protein FWC91_09905, partial [Defluviitaleaceae bacterium]|nr:hypothetical protein [Defluviitaleaceae bacterium]